MKTLLLALLLVTGPAWAEWVKIDSGDLRDFYIDPQTIRIDGNLRRVWIIQNLKERDKSGALSRRAREEYDCKQERYRVLSFSSQSESMAGGTALFELEEPLKWRDIPPGSIGEAMLKIVCTR